MNYDNDALEEKWQKEYEKFDRDYYKLRAYFNRVRKCKCSHIGECDHFQIVFKKVLGGRARKLYQFGLDMDMKKLSEIMKSD